MPRQEDRCARSIVRGLAPFCWTPPAGRCQGEHRLGCHLPANPLGTVLSEVQAHTTAALTNIAGGWFDMIESRAVLERPRLLAVWKVLGDPKHR